MLYEELAPALDQSDLIACYWRFEAEHRDALPFEHVIAPDGTVSVTYYEDAGGDWRAAIAGPSVEARKMPIATPGVWIGLRLNAGVAGPLLRMAATELRDRTLTLAPMDTRSRELRVALAGCRDLLEARGRLTPLLARWRGASQPIDTVVVAASRAIAAAGGDVMIKDLAAGFRLGPRQLRRRFCEQVGLTPKEYARARRARRAFVEALGQLKSRWSDLSGVAGYADQAHLVREFRAIFGMPPQAIDAYIRSIRHERIVDP